MHRYHFFSDQVRVQVLTFGYSPIPSTDTSTSLSLKTLVNSQLEGVSDTRQAGESRIRGGAPRPALGQAAPWTKGSLRPLSPPWTAWCDCRLGRTVLRAGLGPRKRLQGSAAMSATHPTRLETRTEESNARASQRVTAKPRGAMKERAG